MSSCLLIHLQCWWAESCSSHAVGMLVAAGVLPHGLSARWTTGQPWSAAVSVAHRWLLIDEPWQFLLGQFRSCPASVAAALDVLVLSDMLVCSVWLRSGAGGSAGWWSLVGSQQLVPETSKTSQARIMKSSERVSWAVLPWKFFPLLSNYQTWLKQRT